MQIVEKTNFMKSQAWFHFVRSNYVTWFTNWLLGLGGKSAHVVLICTTLYMSAQLYPGVMLPDWLSLIVFIVQMFALDMGGLGLASLARQARKDKNVEGADKADKLSRWLIGMMIAGLVTVSLEQAVSHIPHVSGTVQMCIDLLKITVSLALVVARSVCAVLYGRVVHDLESVYTAKVEVVPIPVSSPQLPAPLPVAVDPKSTTVAIRPARVFSCNYDALNFSQQVAIIASDEEKKEPLREPITELKLPTQGSLQGSLIEQISEPEREPHSEPEREPQEYPQTLPNTEPLRVQKTNLSRATIKLVETEERPVQAKYCEPLREPSRSSETKVRRVLKKNPNATISDIQKATGLQSKGYVSRLRQKVLSELQIVSA